MGLFGVGRQMEKGEQGVMFPQSGPLNGKRFLDLHDELGRFEQFLGGVHHLRAPGGVFPVPIARPFSGAAFHQDPMTPVDSPGDASGGEPHPTFPGFDFSGHPYAHRMLLPIGVGPKCHEPNSTLPPPGVRGAVRMSQCPIAFGRRSPKDRGDAVLTRDKPNIMELIALAPWREAVTYRKSWPHEYVVIKKTDSRPC